MPKGGKNEVCIQAATVAMGGSINIESTLAVVTKARLDSIAVQGKCHCDSEIIGDFDHEQEDNKGRGSSRR